MDPTLVRCSSCEREWHSATMVEGLRIVGSCPRCGGGLVFREPEPSSTPMELQAEPHAAMAPHLVLGVPRR